MLRLRNPGKPCCNYSWVHACIHLPTRPVKIRKNGETNRAPLSPSSHLFHHVVCPPCHPCRRSDVRHVHFCISLLRRVSHIRQESSLELVSALFCLPPLCTIVHICINLSTRILFLAPESMNKAFNVQNQRRSLVFVIQHPLLALLPPRLDFSVVWSTVCFLFIGIPLAALGSPVE